MYRVAAACQGGHIVVCGCRLAWYLIYERISKEPHDLFDGLVARFPTDEPHHPENTLFGPCTWEIWMQHIIRDSASKGDLVIEIRDSRFPVQNPGRPGKQTQSSAVQIDRERRI
jgi:hypothetical protein